jgi:hypothetical protein
MPESEHHQHVPDRQPLGELAESAAALQARVNLHIGWAMITNRSVSPELYDANAKLVDVARQLRQVTQQALEDEALHCGVRQAEQAAQREAAVNGV